MAMACKLHYRIELRHFATTHWLSIRRLLDSAVHFLFIVRDAASSIKCIERSAFFLDNFGQSLSVSLI